MATEEIKKFNANFSNFLGDIDLILESQGHGQGMKTLINLVSLGDMASNISGTSLQDNKINWFCKILEKEVELPESQKKFILRDIHHFENYNLFCSVMLKEAEKLAGISVPDLIYNDLEDDDKELIRAYIDSFINIARTYKEKTAV